MAAKRAADAVDALANDVASAAAPAAKSFMEESADALAGVEGALTGNKRKATTASPASAPPPKKRSPPPMATAIARTESSADRPRPRSDSMDRLADVAGSLLKSATATMVAAASSTSSVPDPMAVPLLPPVTVRAVPAPAPVAAAAVPTGFRKKGAASKPAPAAAAATKPAPSKPQILQAAAAAAAAASAADKDDEEDKANKKAQITYNPDIPMTKEQLTSWRREMRRVRNRESAAASRRKVRDRIEELEEEVAVWKARYREVTSRLGQAEKGEKASAKKKGKGDDNRDGEGGGGAADV